GVERSVGSAWIGAQEGFERFQRARHTPLDHVSAIESTLPPATRVMARLRGAMQTVIDEPAIDSVGDFCVAGSYKPTGFEYLESKMAQSVEDARGVGPTGRSYSFSRRRSYRRAFRASSLISGGSSRHAVQKRGVARDRPRDALRTAGLHDARGGPTPEPASTQESSRRLV